MKIDRKGLLAVLFVLCQFSICTGADPAPISGFYYQDEISNPLPGALITLYKADDNTFVDHTYTRNDGAFTLKGPAAKGKYYVVATKDQFSQKVDFDYDPQAPPNNLMIQHHQPKNTFRKVTNYVGNRFDDVIKILIGLLIGLLHKMLADRRKAHQTITRKIKRIKNSSGEILDNGRQLQQTAEAYGTSTSDEAATEKLEDFRTLATTIGTQVDELTKRLDEYDDLEEAIFTTNKRQGRDDYAAFGEVLKGIKRLMDTIVANPAAVLNAPDRSVRLAQPFETLRASNLLKNY